MPPSNSTDRNTTDRNLLFGILAVQTDFISEKDLVAAMNSWMLDKQRPLDEHLVKSGALDPAMHSVIDALVTKHIEQHNNDTARSLSAMQATESLKQGLGLLNDRDVQASLGHLAQPPIMADSHATMAAPKKQAHGEALRYSVLRPHAAGGLGQVSVARDDELNREVALKELLDRHADDPNSRSRFLQEAEITGGLEHPGVVPIYGLGQYADGRPYYAMRFIRGDSLRQWIERFHQQADKVWTSATDQLQLRRLLARLIDVCNAIEYAHSRGVVHRDIKPSNIMLGQYGETLVVDWGLAKAIGKSSAKSSTESTVDDVIGPTLPEAVLQPQSGSGSAPTQMGAAIGTPAFMSPEQAAGRIDTLGPASDIFSLGATLYMLLTGRPPQEGSDVGEVLMRVQRGLFLDPREINGAVPRGLEAICLKAMQLDPGHRYASARAMGEDIEAWLGDEKLAALPESLLSKSRRWVRKHRTIVTSGVAALVVALGVTAAGLVIVSAANQREREAKDSALHAKEEVVRQSQRAEKLLLLSRSSLENYDRLSQAEELKSFPMREFRGQLLEAAIQYYGALSQVAGETEADRADRADASFRLAETYYEIGEIDKAAESYQNATQRYAQLAGEFPDNSEYRYNEATAYVDHADMLVFSQRSAEAERLLQQGITQLESLNSKDVSNGEYQRAYAYSLASEAERLRTIGKLAEASAKLAKATEVLRSHRQQQLSEEEAEDTQFLLGRVLLQHAALESNGQWKFDASLGKYAEAETLLKELYDADEAFADAGYLLANAKHQKSRVLYQQGLGNDAVTLAFEGRELVEAIDAIYPDVPDYYRLYADLLNQIGELKVGVPTTDARNYGLEAVEQGIGITETLLEQMQSQPDDVLRLAVLQKTAGELHAALEQSKQAETYYTSAIETLSKFDESENEPSIDLQFTKGETLFAVAEGYNDSFQLEKAMALLDQAEQVLGDLLKQAPGLGNAHHKMGMVQIERAQCYINQVHFADAIEQLDHVIAKTQAISKIPDSEYMEQGYQVVSTAAKALRLLGTRTIWESFDNLIRQHRYAELLEQTTKYVRYQKDKNTQYACAKVLANAVGAIQADERLAPSKQAQLSEQHAQQAVAWLEELWQQGYIKRKTSRVGALFSSKPTLATLQEAEEFAAIRDRKDYQDMLKRIETK